MNTSEKFEMITFYAFMHFFALGSFNSPFNINELIFRCVLTIFLPFHFSFLLNDYKQMIHMHIHIYIYVNIFLHIYRHITVFTIFGLALLIRIGFSRFSVMIHF